jgi:RNA polymerase sigma-70 factor (ECF subfamily)
MADEADDLARARRGDRAAFAALVRRHQRRVYAAALHILGNHGDADDVTQETFIRAFKGLDGFDGRSDFFTWLYRIAVNTSLNAMRSSKRGQALVSKSQTEAAHGGGRPESLGATPRTPADGAAMSQDLMRVLEAVATLTAPLRVTLILATVEELPYKQIAEILDIPEGTVAWRVNEARRLLRLKFMTDDASAPLLNSDRSTR